MVSHFLRRGQNPEVAPTEITVAEVAGQFLAWAKTYCVKHGLYRSPNRPRAASRKSA